MDEIDERRKEEVERLNTLESEVLSAYQNGIIHDKWLSGANLVDLLKEQRRIIELRSLLMGLLPDTDNAAEIEN